MLQREKLEESVRPIVESRGAFLVEVALRGAPGGGRTLEIFVDADTGVTTDLCAELSREISRALDTANLMLGRYHLVVSSPGIDRPLVFARQYPKNVGRRLTVTMRGPDEARLRLQGELTVASPEEITLRLEDGSLRTVSFGEILEARVLTAW
jgi:ribosome maturation factor RimP